MADRISGGNTQAVQQQRTQETQESSPSAKALQGRGAQKDDVSSVRQHASSFDVKQGGGKSWKARAAKLDGTAPRSKASATARKTDSGTASKTASKHAAKPAAKIVSKHATGRPAMPAPYSGPGARTLQRGAAASRATISRSGSNPFDVRRREFKEQLQQRTQEYDRRTSELKPFQRNIYQDEKAAIASLLQQTPGDAPTANKQFSELVSHASAIESLFRGDDSYLGDMMTKQW